MSDNEGPEDPEQQEDNEVFAVDGTMNPNHPLLQRAQQALKKQLLDSKQQIEEQLREKSNALQQAKKKREDVGVELYGFQQGLAKLQLQLEKTQENYDAINNMRVQAEGELNSMRRALDDHEGTTKEERVHMEGTLRQLEQQASTLHQIEQYNEAMKGEIAVTRRAAYGAEEALQKLEKQKMQQDLIIDNLQNTLKRLHQEVALYDAQLDAQKRETRAAQETLAQAETEMEAVHFEKKQLVAQWKSSLTAVQQREEALSAIQAVMRSQMEQEMAIHMEIGAFRKDIVAEQIKNEQLTSVLRKVEGEQEYLTKQVESLLEKQSRVADMASKLGRSLEQTEEQMARVEMEAKVLATETDATDKAFLKTQTEVRALEEEALEVLGSQTTAERSAGKTAADTRDLRRKIRDEESGIAEVQNELAKLQVDVLNTEAHNERLSETLTLLDEELAEKLAMVGKYEQEIRRRHDEIEKKTREVDVLNKRYQKLAGGLVDVETGPLEATINSLQKEIDTKGDESRDLQKRWIMFQVELVAIQNENNKMAETVARMRAEHSVLFQRRQRLDAQQASHEREMRTLANGTAHLHTDLQRVNALIAQNTNLRAILKEDNFNLESKIGSELKDMEADAIKLQSAIEQSREQKREVLSEIVETERQLMLWERKIQLEKEMQDMLDPSMGADVIGAMKKEIHRMELRHSELLRVQEKLMSDLERALAKRDLIGVKARAMNTKKSADLTKQQLEKAATDMQRSIRDTEKEVQATDERLAVLESRRAVVAERVAATSASCSSYMQREEVLRLEADTAVARKYAVLLATTRHQKASKRFEELEGGKYKAQVEDPTTLDSEMQRSMEKHSKIQQAIEQLRSNNPELSSDLDRILCHMVSA